MEYFPGESTMVTGMIFYEETICRVNLSPMEPSKGQMISEYMNLRTFHYNNSLQIGSLFV